MRSRTASQSPALKAFTMVELLVAVSILAVILVLVFGITQQTAAAWKGSAGKIESFQGARAAFESMTRRISQATLNTYYEYFDANGKPRGEHRTLAELKAFEPSKYGRYSDLHFVTGKNLLASDQITHAIFFQAPLGYTGDITYKRNDTTLNSTGFFLEYGADDGTRPGVLTGITPTRHRYRLMQFTQPAENLSVYRDAASANPLAWFAKPLDITNSSRPARQIAENIVALVIRPKRSVEDDEAAAASLSPNYEYDSREPWPANGAQPTVQHQLPPLVEVTMAAIDEASAIKLGNPEKPTDFGQLGAGGFFRNAAMQKQNLEDLQKVLAAAPDNKAGNKTKLNYHVFRADVPIRASKWSE